MPGVPDKPSAWGHEGTRTNQGSRIDYITEKPYFHHHLEVPRAPIFGLLVAISWHWLRLACSGWLAGFESTCVWSSKLLWRKYDLYCYAFLAATGMNELKGLSLIVASYKCQGWLINLYIAQLVWIIISRVVISYLWETSLLAKRVDVFESNWMDQSVLCKQKLLWLQDIAKCYFTFAGMSSLLVIHPHYQYQILPVSQLGRIDLAVFTSLTLYPSWGFLRYV